MYVQLDTLQLSDVFEDFRKTYLEIYELDPARFISIPSLAWQACLKITNIKLELICFLCLKMEFVEECVKQ